jgi:AraC-like DNA-binding protein
MTPQESKVKVAEATKALRKAQDVVDQRRRDLIEAMRRAHWDDAVPIAEVARVVGVSRSYVHRVVTAEPAPEPARAATMAQDGR